MSTNDLVDKTAALIHLLLLDFYFGITRKGNSSVQLKGIIMLKKFVKLLALGTLASAPFTAAHAGLYLGFALPYQNISSGEANTEGFNPRLTFGYGSLLSEWFYLSGEVFAGPFFLQTYNNADTQGDLRVNYSYGASLLPGVNIDGALVVYLRLGAIGTKFKQTGSNKVTWQGGFGVEDRFSPEWSIRGEFDRTSYGTVDNFNSVTSSEYAIAINYHFGQ